MNWPPLSEGLTHALDDLLESAYQSKPNGGLLEYVVDELQQRSGWEAAEYQAHFEKACSEVRTYKLEDVCPEEADPFQWIRKRYNDEAILTFLRSRGAEAARKAKISESVVQELPKYVPELAYFRNMPEKKRWFDTYMMVITNLTLETPSASFAKHPAAPLVLQVRDILDGGGVEVDFEEALGVGLMTVLLDHPNVVKHRSDVATSPFSAFEAVTAQYPTLFRGPSTQHDRLRVIATLPGVIAPMIYGEMLPAQLIKLKEAGGIEHLLAYQVATFLADCASDPKLITPRLVSAATRAAACVAEVPIKTVHVLNSMFLEKTAIEIEYPFVVGGAATAEKNPLQCRSVLRLALMTGMANEAGGCLKVEAAFAELNQSEKQTLQRELCKDGVLQYPAFHLINAAKWLREAAKHNQLRASFQLLATIFQEVGTEVAGTSLREPNVVLDMGSLYAVASSLTASGPPIDSTVVSAERSGNVFTLVAHRIE